MKSFIGALFLLFALPSAAQDMQLPCNGRWFVMQGGDTPNVNHHMVSGPQAYGIDLAKVGGAGGRELARGTASRADDFFTWDESVLAPADGTVLAAVNDLPDNPLGTKDLEHPAGNYVAIRIAAERFVFLGHLQHGSVAVHAGDSVRRGQLVGRCGNSGNSDFPHIHLHMQDAPDFNTGRGVNPVFGPINVELTGKRFEGVTWPLIRGLFVANP